MLTTLYSIILLIGKEITESQSDRKTDTKSESKCTCSVVLRGTSSKEWYLVTMEGMVAPGVALPVSEQ